jgi:aspartyl-tRNA(Asn)/glutamyl-tRNA(Gln) amidotransferase subunit B
MSEYLPTIGLEVHAELKTKTKMFCDSKNDPDEGRPNVNICPVCMAHPGTLPVINHEAVRHVLKVGLALGGARADYTEFDRKNYFYPDLPKGYQISQYEYPLVRGGELHGVAVTRVHLEEDTAGSIHDEGSGATLIDFNRSGIPLMELVTEPVMHTPEEAGAFARELQLTLRYLGVSSANMEKGEMRVEANVSVAKDSASGEKKLGTKVEIKNLNSFRAMERAVAYEIQRQKRLLQEGGVVVQETRGWDEAKQETFPQRVKEGSADYRYFPDPDLPPFKLSEVVGYSDGSLEKEMPELPWKRRARYIALGVKADDADAYVRDTRLGGFFDEVIEGMPEGSVLVASNYIANDLVSILQLREDLEGARRDIEGRDSESQSEIQISARNFKGIVEMLVEGKISSRAAKDILVAYVNGEAEEPRRYAEEKGLLKASGSALEAVVADVIAKNPKVVGDFRTGKGSALEFLLGQCMKALRGSGDPVMLRELLLKNLG